MLGNCPPIPDRGLQELPDYIWAAFAEVELVVQVADEHHFCGLAVCPVRAHQGFERLREIFMRNHHNLGAGVRAMPMRGMIRPHRAGGSYAIVGIASMVWRTGASTFVVDH